MQYPETAPQTPQPNGAPGQKPHSNGGKAKKRGRNALKVLLLIIAAVVFIVTAAAGGGWAGYRSGVQARQAVATEVAVLSLDEQFTMALVDLQEGRYDIARQRLEYILAVDPGYPGASEQLASALSVLYATATPTPPLATITPTPTRDLRPVQELFEQAQAHAASASWSETIDTLLALRKSDPAYETARVDGLMFVALRYRGYDKIWQAGDLEGGIYDLALAARFGPLDSQSAAARELARLYLFGSAFWEVYPEQAVYWFGQVASAAPGLRDLSGWTAARRYAESLIHFGDQLMASDPCAAVAQYELAMAAGGNGAQAKRDAAMLACMPPTNTPKPTDVITPTAPVVTTEPPVITTEPPVITTEPPVVTTEPPPVTTEPPVVTTEPPPATTEPPVETIAPPYP